MAKIKEELARWDEEAAQAALYRCWNRRPDSDFLATTSATERPRLSGPLLFSTITLGTAWITW
jgi:hypothetical protein